MSHYFEVLHFVHYTNRTLQKIPPYKWIYSFEQNCPHAHVTFLKQSNSSHQTSASVKTSISSSLGSLLGKTQKGSEWPSYDPVSLILVLRQQQHLGKSHCWESLLADLKGTEKQQVSPADTAQKDMATTKNPTTNKKAAVDVQVLKPHR